MNISEEMLLAYVDGELDAAGVAMVEQATRADPDVAAAVNRALWLRQRISQAYASVLDEPVPARLLAAANGASSVAPADPGNVVSLDSARSPGPAPTRAWRWPQLTALAASLALGVLISPWLRPDGQPSMLDTSGGALLAGGELAMTLESRLAAEGPGQGLVSVGLSFRAADGRYCRTFTLAPPHSMAGLACRDADGWQVSALGEATPEAGELRLASAALPPVVLAEVDARLEGDPLDADAERAARDAGWR